MTRFQELFTKTTISSSYKKHKKLILSLLATLLLVAAVIAVVAGVNSGKNTTTASSDNLVAQDSHSHVVLKSACSNTLYPDLCFSAVSNSAQKVTSQKDVIELSINLTTRYVQHNFFTIEGIASWKNLTKREKTAIHDCLETVDETLDELHKAVEDLHEYPNGKTLNQHADDLKTLISAAITNQETCLDGFSHDAADKHVRGALLEGQVHVEHMCSNVLAMIRNMTDTDIAEYEVKTGRKLGEEAVAGESGWPAWLSAGDRRLLQSSSVRPDVVVAADGSGNHRTVGQAVAAAPSGSSRRFVIRIKAGVYRENVEVPKSKKNIMFLGDGRTNTIITGNRNVVDGSTTFNSATVAVVGEGFLARDITFQNTAGPSKHQAVALRVGADFSAFYKCDFYVV